MPRNPRRQLHAGVRPTRIGRRDQSLGHRSGCGTASQRRWSYATDSKQEIGLRALNNWETDPFSDAELETHGSVRGEVYAEFALYIFSKANPETSRSEWK